MRTSGFFLVDVAALEQQFLDAADVIAVRVREIVAVEVGHLDALFVERLGPLLPMSTSTSFPFLPMMTDVCEFFLAKADPTPGKQRISLPSLALRRLSICSYTAEELHRGCHSHI
jgi:hypothetical protein